MGKKSKKQKKRQHKPVQESKSTRISLLEKHPERAAIVVIVLLLLTFYNPVMLSNKTLLPPDKVASKSFQPLMDDALGRGIYPFWDPYIYGGMPLFASLTRAPYVDALGTVVRGVIWLVKTVIPLTDFSMIFANYILLGLCVYLLLRSKKIRPIVALYASIGLLFVPQVVAYSAFGHTTKLGSVVFIPIVFLLVERLLEKRNLLSFSLLGLAFGLQLLRAHVQICFYTYLMVGLYFLYWLVYKIREKQKPRLFFQTIGLLAGALLMGILISSVLNFSVWEYSQYSIRGGGASGGLDYGYATSWSFPVSEIATFFIPSFMGFGGATYWGPMTFTDFPLYFGLSTFLFALLGIVLKRDRTVRFFALLAIITLLISFGKHLPVLYGPMFKFIPFFDKFRAPKMIQILLALSMVVLAGYGIQALIELEVTEQSRKRIRRVLMIFGGIVVFLFLLLLLGKGLYLGWASRIGQNANNSYDKALNDGFKALAVFGFSAGLVVLTLRKRLNVKWLPIWACIIVCVDLWTVDGRFVNFRPKTDSETLFRATPEVAFLKAQEGLFRILPVEDNRPPNWYQYHFLQSAWGYQGAKMRTIQELMNAMGMPTGPGGAQGFLKKYLKVEGGRIAFKSPEEVSPADAAAHAAFLKMMNVRYVVCPYLLPDTMFTLVFPPAQQGSNGIWEYKGFLPRVFFPGEVRPVQGNEAMLGYIASGDFDPAMTALVEERPPDGVGSSGDEQARILEYDLHRINIETEVTKPVLMVVSEMYYPAGWKAWVDGKPVDIVRTNYLLRGIYLEPGSHQVEFKFVPGMFHIGLITSISAFAVLGLGVVVGWRMEKRKLEPEEGVS